MIKIFCGYEEREKKGFAVFLDSLMENTSVQPVIYPLRGQQRDGTNAFTYSRFHVPAKCGFTGTAIWMDGSDMLLLGDPAELISHHIRGHQYAVHVVKHDYRTRHARKYIGTPMEADNADYPRKNWSSLIVWDCGHAANRVLTPEFIASHPGAYLHRFGWLPDKLIGELPPEWNVLIGEQPIPPDAKLLHYTLGIPGFAHYAQGPGARDWHEVATTLHSER